jgi:hypothetical protein
MLPALGIVAVYTAIFVAIYCAIDRPLVSAFCRDTAKLNRSDGRPLAVISDLANPAVPAVVPNIFVLARSRLLHRRSPRCSGKP